MFEIGVNYTPFKKKPIKQLVGLIQDSVELATFNDITELADHIKSGCSFYCSTFKDNHPADDDFIDMSLLALDFDNDNDAFVRAKSDAVITPQDVLERLDEFGLKPSLMYHSFRSTPELPKFRVVFLLDTPITDIEVARFCIKKMQALFKEADISCKNPSRLYFGSHENSIILCNKEETSLDHLFIVLETYVRSVDSNPTRQIPKYTAKNTHHSFVDVPNALLVEDFDFQLAAQNCRIFKDFLEGRWLTYLQVRGICMNLLHIEGGISLARKILNRPDNPYDQNPDGGANVRSILTAIQGRGYKPERLSNFSPYESDHIYSTLIAAGKPKGAAAQEDIVITKEADELRRNRMTLANAEVTMVNFFNRYANAPSITDATRGENLYIASLAPGIGKTKQLKLKFVGRPCVIAFKTHALKHEFFTSLAPNEQDKCIVVPEFPVFLSELLNKHFERLYSLGLRERASQALKRVAASQPPAKFKGGTISSDDARMAREYLAQCKLASEATDKTILTTHARASFTDYKPEMLIFDEDPFTTLYEIKEYDASNLLVIAEHHPGKEARSGAKVLYNHLTTTAGIAPKPAVPGLTISALEKWFESNEAGVELVDFLERGTYFITGTESEQGNSNHSYKVKFIIPIALPQNKKVLICSATAYTEMYKLPYPRLHSLDARWIQLTGKQVQDLSSNTSRQALYKEENWNKIAQRVCDDVVLSYKSERFPTQSKTLYAGNSEGSNELEQVKRGHVVCTMRLNEAHYLLYAAALGVTGLQHQDISKMEQHRVTYNGVVFTLFTFAHPILQKMMLAFIDAENVQLAGRFRALRQPNTVIVHCKVPTTNFDCAPTYDAAISLLENAPTEEAAEYPDLIYTMALLTELDPNDMVVIANEDKDGGFIYTLDGTPRFKVNAEGQQFSYNRGKWYTLIDRR